jgi:hypothetical protein
MADIALGAEICRELLAGFLQEINSDGTRVASHSASGIHKFNDATRDARCQIQNVVDRNPIVDDIAPVDVQLLEESGKKAAKIVVRGPGGEGAGLEPTGDLWIGSHDMAGYSGEATGRLPSARAHAANGVIWSPR